MASGGVSMTLGTLLARVFKICGSRGFGIECYEDLVADWKPNREFSNTVGFALLDFFLISNFQKKKREKNGFFRRWRMV